MGVDRAVAFSDGVPPWPTVAALLEQHGAGVQMRMIDGELVPPDEEPSSTWRELRVALAGEMVTIRRQPPGVNLVAWGNPSAGQRQLWNVLAWAFARCGGAIAGGSGLLSAEAFAASAEMPPGWKG